MPRGPGGRLWSIRLSSALVLLVAIVAVTTFAQSHAGQRTLTRLGLVGPAQRYTELAFVGAQHLPTQLQRSLTEVHLPFTITNREGRAQRYGWTIVKRTGTTTTRQLAIGAMSLRDGQQAYLDPEVAVSCTASETRIDIRLTSGEVIDFVVQCTGRASPAAVKTVARVTPAQARSKTGTDR